MAGECPAWPGSLPHYFSGCPPSPLSLGQLPVTWDPLQGDFLLFQCICERHPEYMSKKAFSRAFRIYFTYLSPTQSLTHKKLAKNCQNSNSPPRPIHGCLRWTIIIHAHARVGTGLHCTDLVSAHCPALEDWKYASIVLIVRQL